MRHDEKSLERFVIKYKKSKRELNRKSSMDLS
jgi:hypothetical protein